MTPGQERLYRYLGFKGPLAQEGAGRLQTRAFPGEISRGIESAPGAPGAFVGLAGAAVPEPEAGDPGPMTRSDLDQLEQELESEPDETVARVRRGWEGATSEAAVRALIQQARGALDRPDVAIAELEAHAASRRGSLPAGFTFPEKTDDILIDPSRYKYETVRDVLAWIFHAGPGWLKYMIRPRRAPFRWDKDSGSQFTYPLANPNGATRVALFSDFGTGEYHSRYIARQIFAQQPDYAIHLGDVYYAGKPDEFTDNFRAVLDPLLGRSRFFAMNANHEMLSGGRSYFEYLDYKRKASSVLQEQEGSYFCLRSARFQIIGIDTAYHHSRGGEGRYRETRLVDWLHQRLREGKDTGRINILLSPDEPFTLGSSRIKKLLSQDLARIVKEQLIDLWFWGNTHYCALYQRSLQTPFLSSCIGHGGYPYDRVAPKDAAGTLTGVRFLETSARFPESTGLRQDRGNNGFVLMTLHDSQSIELQYLDWMGQLRHHARIEPVGSVAAGGHIDFAE